jgi:branched-chain amino acid aminotransferase
MPERINTTGQRFRKVREGVPMGHTISVKRTETGRHRPQETDLGFGKYFADHMFLADWTATRSWHSPRVEPYGPLALDPAAAVFHYGQALFDGLKAFRGQDDSGVSKIRLFRPDYHCQRMAAGAERLCMPAVDSALLEEGIRTLVRVDESWVPSLPGTSLYIRPTLIATEPFLGVRPAQRCLLFVITSPVGAYYPEGMNPVKIWVEETLVRAARGGLGAVKAGANYAASLLGAEVAKRRGYSQVLWLDAANHRNFEEVGTMNLFVRLDDELVTPPLSGSILAGATRDSVITLARDWGIKVSEREIDFAEVLAAHQHGRLREIFGSGTAAVISPVGELGHPDHRIIINDFQVGELAGRLYDTITGIQTGRLPDRYGWMREVS